MPDQEPAVRIEPSGKHLRYKLFDDSGGIILHTSSSGSYGEVPSNLALPWLSQAFYFFLTTERIITPERISELGARRSYIQDVAAYAISVGLSQDAVTASFEYALLETEDQS